MGGVGELAVGSLRPGAKSERFLTRQLPPISSVRMYMHVMHDSETQRMSGSAALRCVTRSRACDGRHVVPGTEGQLAIMCDGVDGRYARRAHLLHGLTWIAERVCHGLKLFFTVVKRRRGGVRAADELRGHDRAAHRRDTPAPGCRREFWWGVGPDAAAAAQGCG
jgi:hypothetical protein